MSHPRDCVRFHMDGASLASEPCMAERICARDGCGRGAGGPRDRALSANSGPQPLAADREGLLQALLGQSLTSHLHFYHGEFTPATLLAMRIMVSTKKELGQRGASGWFRPIFGGFTGCLELEIQWA